MINICVPIESKTKDSIRLVNDLLDYNESIKGDFIAQQGLGGQDVRIYGNPSYTINNEDRSYSNYATLYRVLITNNRVMIVNIDSRKESIMGITSLDYTEIKKVVMDDLDEIKVYLECGKYYVFDIQNEIYEKSVKERTVASIEYFIDKIEPSKIKSKVLEGLNLSLAKWIGSILCLALIFLQALNIIN